MFCIRSCVRDSCALCWQFANGIVESCRAKARAATANVDANSIDDDDDRRRVNATTIAIAPTTTATSQQSRRGGASSSAFAAQRHGAAGQHARAIPKSVVFVCLVSIVFKTEQNANLFADDDDVDLISLR